MKDNYYKRDLVFWWVFFQKRSDETKQQPSILNRLPKTRKKKFLLLVVSQIGQRRAILGF